MERTQCPNGRLSRPLLVLALAGLAPALALLLSACGGDVAPETAPAGQVAASAPTGVHIRTVPGVPTIPAGPIDARGHQARVACSTCHSIKAPDTTRKTGAELTAFHQGLQVAHGSLSCLSCHNEDDYDSLRLADGHRVPFERVMDLCAQCHGPQARDYAHGAHGGMSGYWDTTRGLQTRNQCTHCHAPHAPAYPAMKPTFKPRDRFLPPTRESNDD
ncbi:MAG: hypothetical protein P1V36_07270 [Planctomycetota bacterium]|nr:hypothetical protein [Planctomycetota bacterium]